MPFPNDVSIISHFRGTILFQISIILCIYRGAVVGVNGGLYFMLGISLVGFVAIELLMVSIFLTLNYVKYFILERVIYSYMLNLTSSFSMIIQ